MNQGSLARGDRIQIKKAVKKALDNPVLQHWFIFILLLKCHPDP
jgi:hypothetical protein